MISVMSSEYKVCRFCVMDTSDKDIVFDDDGECNHCKRAKKLLEKRTIQNQDDKLRQLNKLIHNIKVAGKGKKYDCIIGLSGGLDSTFVAYEVVRLGLRPLAVHLDNGWNSELAVSNMEKIIDSLNIDLYTYVIDWEEYKDIQMAFLQASTPDSEVPTDHAIISILYKMANKLNIKYVLNGDNYATESILPLKWGYGYHDFKYIKHVHKIFGNKRMKTYPRFTLIKLFYYMFIKRIKVIPFLDLLNFNKEHAIEIVTTKLQWVHYGQKHFESVYTRFFQAYILPVKFNIDKRKCHLSSLIVSGQITRDKALELLQENTYPKGELSKDYKYIIDKFGIENDDFESIMLKPLKNFLDYPNHFNLLEKIKKIKQFVNKALGALFFINFVWLI